MFVIVFKLITLINFSGFPYEINDFEFYILDYAT